MPSTRLHHLSMALAAMLPLVACTTREAQIRASGTIGQTDSEFVTAAYRIAQLDEQAGKLAATKAVDPRVKDLAGKMSSEASVLYPNLQGVLRAEGQPAPSSPPPEIVAELKTLSTLSGPAFDKQFVADELAAHQRAVSVLQKEDGATKDGAMRTQVETELPAVKANLAKLQFLSSDLSGSNKS